MCGICGYIDLKRRIETRSLKDMNNIANYRGPDDEGYTLFDKDSGLIQAKGPDTAKSLQEFQNILEVPACQIGLAHRRLSILDLSDLGHQPMLSDESDIVLCFNGEIYNYLELKRELEADGDIFKTETDSEVIIHAYKKWGENCVQKFNGMWAFALFDINMEKLFCSRDRLGVKPFHYYFTRDCFIFSSELKQMIQIPFIERKLNQEVFLTNFLFKLSDYDNETLIKGIYLLKPSHNLVITIKKEGLEKGEYQYWALKSDDKFGESPEVLQEQLGRVLMQSINYRLRSDVPLGGLLSGGLDSSSLLTLANEFFKNGQTIETFTACYDDQMSEKKYADIVNKYNGFSANYIYPICEDLKKELENIVWHCEGIINFEHIGFYKVLEAAKEKGLHILLNGQCGDETLFGYERYYAYYYLDLLKQGKVKKFFKEFNLGIKNSAISLKQMIGFLIYFNMPSVRIYTKRMKLGKYIKSSILKKLPQKKLKNILTAKSLNQLFNKEITATQLPHILRWDDRSYMAFSIESRVPFVDYEFIEFASKIPHGTKIQNGYTKNLLRNYMNDKLPAEIVWRKNKMGFSAPQSLWDTELNENFYYGYLDDPICKKIFKVDKLKQLVKKEPDNNTLKMAVIMIIFMRKFNVAID